MGAERVIVALDVPSASEALHLVEALRPEIRLVKIGPVLFYNRGATLLENLEEASIQSFIDLKLHDIPNTVAGGISVLAKLPTVHMLTLHALGGREMIEAARAEAEKLPSSRRPKLLAVTVLTSMDQNSLRDVGLSGASVEECVLALARLAMASGADGVVCSPLEVSRLREELGEKALIVVPGIRLEGSHDDQKRTATPGQALAAGASHLVVGRPILRSSTPKEAFLDIVREVNRK